jgi:hypothetical protein
MFATASAASRENLAQPSNSTSPVDIEMAQFQSTMQMVDPNFSVRQQQIIYQDIQRRISRHGQAST